MAKALRLAAKGRGDTSPNPMVGAVVVSKNRTVGHGYHRRAGGPHAEVIALKAAGNRARGGTLYVTLEPCCHTSKRTPPCVPTIIASKPRRVVVAVQDPNPQVQGRGIGLLRRAGIDVTVGCLRDRAERLNEAYIHWTRTGRPFVLMKAAMTLDGKIATAGGESQWITGESARLETHRLRRRVDAVMVGIGTILKDDPQLTARISSKQSSRATGRQPIRVIVDSRLRIPLNARVALPSSSSRTIIVTTKLAPTHRIKALRARGITILTVPALSRTCLLRELPHRFGQDGDHLRHARRRKRTKCRSLTCRIGEPRAFLHCADAPGGAGCQRGGRRLFPQATRRCSRPGRHHHQACRTGSRSGRAYPFVNVYVLIWIRSKVMRRS